MYTSINLPRTQKVVNLLQEQPFTSDLDITTLKSGREYLAQLEEQLVKFFDDSLARRQADEGPSALAVHRIAFGHAERRHNE